MPAPATDDSPVFAVPAPLPKGPHRLTREEVAASQRARLLGAVVTVVGRSGFKAATLAAILREAGVSRVTFYDLFADKEECLIAAYDHYAEVVFQRMALRVPSEGSWDEFVSTAITALLTMLDQDRTTARVMFTEMYAAGPTLERTALGTRTLAELIAARHAEIRADDPTLGEIPTAVFVGYVRGARELLKEALETTPDKPLTELAPTLIFWLRAIILGAKPAAETAG